MKKMYKILIIIVLISLLVVLELSINLDINETVQTSANSQSKYEILVDVEDSVLFVFEDNMLIKQYKCSGGKWSTPSPIGTWTIISKAKWGEGFGRKLDGIKCSMGSVSVYMVL